MSYGIQKAPYVRVRQKGNGSKVYAASGIIPRFVGVWSARPIMPEGEERVCLSDEIRGNRNYSTPIGGGSVRPFPKSYTWTIRTMEESPAAYAHRINTFNSPQDALGLDLDDGNTPLPAENIAPTPEKPSVVEQMSDEELTDSLNNAIAEAWRLKTCSEPYCLVQARFIFGQRDALLAEYKVRKILRDMPPIEEPVHVLTYGRYKLAKAMITWSENRLKVRPLWPLRVYVKAAAFAMETAFGGKYLTMFIVSSPVLGFLAGRKLGGGLLWGLVGAYAAMTVAALTPLGLYSLAQLLGAKEEKDFVLVEG